MADISPKLDALLTVRFEAPPGPLWAVGHNTAMNHPAGPERPVVELLHAARSAALYYRDDPRLSRQVVALSIKSALCAVDNVKLGRLDAVYLRSQLRDMADVLGLTETVDVQGGADARHRTVPGDTWCDLHERPMITCLTVYGFLLDTCGPTGSTVRDILRDMSREGCRFISDADDTNHVVTIDTDVVYVREDQET